MQAAVGDRVRLRNYRYKAEGTVRFLGDLPGEGSLAGVELDLPIGKNDGERDGVRYFTCQPGHGIFIRQDWLIKLGEEESQGTARRLQRSKTDGVMETDAAIAELQRALSEVNARIGVVESDQSKSPGHGKLHELEMRVESLEASKRLGQGQGQDRTFKDAISQNHEMEASATGAAVPTNLPDRDTFKHGLSQNEMEASATDAALVHSEHRITQRQVQLLQDADARVDKVGIPTGRESKHHQAEQSVCGAYEDVDRRKRPLMHDDVQASQQRLQVSHADIGDSMKSIGRLEKSISSLNRQHTGLTGEMWSMKETVRKLQAHIQDLSDKYEATQQSLSKLQRQMNESLATSLQRENATQERLLEAEASQKQVLEAAAEAQKIVLSLTRRVGAVEVTHMNAERAAVVAATETRQLREQIMLGDMLGPSPKEYQDHQEGPGPGSQVRSKSIDSALSHHGTAHDSCLPSSAMRSEVRSRAGGRSFLNWPWKP
ncbi:CAP-Gly domain-containing linker protein 1 [Symbiodinium microadriaticum]|uniref:CAP-Gly domain-containing linker protein 1 n=1 Tax=Symbiodinium microadriaticum TaxID=2951 RepID=A0A1Q9DDX0_SYMMI|nr:CAP-Gly domain-containing linker protein 1 [Symbiodinium microadriaticum]CAE7680649.1 Clip1 [Symbiodinium microadriaticum]CAE7797493.1 Clip1 [Symbiodinium sp. KB8]